MQRRMQASLLHLWKRKDNDTADSMGVEPRKEKKRPVLHQESLK